MPIALTSPIPAAAPSDLPTNVELAGNELADIDADGTQHSRWMGRIRNDLIALVGFVGLEDDDDLQPTHEGRIKALEAGGLGGGPFLATAGGTMTGTATMHATEYLTGDAWAWELAATFDQPDADELGGTAINLVLAQTLQGDGVGGTNLNSLWQAPALQGARATGGPRALINVEGETTYDPADGTLVAGGLFVQDFRLHRPAAGRGGPGDVEVMGGGAASFVDAQATQNHNGLHVGWHVAGDGSPNIFASLICNRSYAAFASGSELDASTHDLTAVYHQISLWAAHAASTVRLRSSQAVYMVDAGGTGVNVGTRDLTYQHAVYSELLESATTNRFLAYGPMDDPLMQVNEHGGLGVKITADGAVGVVASLISHSDNPGTLWLGRRRADDTPFPAAGGSIAFLRFMGWDGTAMASGASLRALTAGAWDDSPVARPTTLSVYVAGASGAEAEQLVIDGDDGVTVTGDLTLEGALNFAGGFTSPLTVTRDNNVAQVQLVHTEAGAGHGPPAADELYAAVAFLYETGVATATEVGAQLSAFYDPVGGSRGGGLTLSTRVAGGALTDAVTIDNAQNVELIRGVLLAHDDVQLRQLDGAAELYLQRVNAGSTAPGLAHPLGRVRFGGWDGASSWVDAVTIGAVASEAWDADETGAALWISLTQGDTTGEVEKLRFRWPSAAPATPILDLTGRLAVGAAVTSTTAPTWDVHVVGGNAAQAGIGIDASTTGPTAPAADAGAVLSVYQNGSGACFLLVTYKDGATTRYRYMALDGTTATWAHATALP